MQIQIETNPRGPLKVVGDLPDARLAILEGLNGIGKTLAVHLLEICTGTVPYPIDSSAWRSLCDGLGEFAITISRLKGASELSITADSRDWLNGEGVPRDGWFRTITVDGKQATLAHVIDLIAVHRLSGDQGIADTFAAFTEAQLIILRRWHSRHIAEGDTPLADLIARTTSALNAMGPWTSSKLSALRSKSAQANIELRRVRSRFDTIEKRRVALADAIEIKSKLTQMRGRTPGLMERLDHVDARIDEVGSLREAILGQLSETAARMAQAEPAQRELKNARSTLERNLRSLANLRGAAVATATTLDVGPEPTAVSGLIERLSLEVRELERQRNSVDASGAMKVLLSELGGRLSEAEENGLGSEVVIDDLDAKIQLTVTQTRSGMEAREAYLSSRQPEPGMEDLEKRLAGVREQRERALALLETLNHADRLSRLVETNEARLNRALLADAGDVYLEAMALEERRRAMDAELLELAEQRAGLAQQLGIAGGVLSEEALTAQFASRLLQLDISEENLGSELQNVEREFERIQAEFDRLRKEATDFDRDLATAEAEIKHASNHLTRTEDLVWIVRDAAEGSRDLANGTDALIRTIDHARSVAELIEGRLAAMRRQVETVERALASIASLLKGGPTVGGPLYVPELQRWLAGQISNWFRNPKIRQELLPGSSGDIKVDIAKREVTWTDANGPRSRPMEAFSSGDQAFAYTRARLAMLDDAKVRAVNRLIVLDEFGAFMARDRMQGLLGYLTDRAADYESDQILVVLPLSHDYATEAARSPVADDRSRLESLAAQVQRRGYAVLPVL